MNLIQYLGDKVNQTGAVIATATPRVTAKAEAVLNENSRIAPRGTGNFNQPVNIYIQLTALANTLLNILTLLAGILAVLYLIWYGIVYITAGSNPDRAKLARAGIINAIIGIIVIVATFFIIRFAVSSGSSLGGIIVTPAPTPTITPTPVPLPVPVP